MKKEILIRKSKKKTLPFVFLSIAMLVLFIYYFITDKTKYPKGKDFYWIAIILIGAGTCKFLWDYFDKRPLYKLDNKGIYVCERDDFIRWDGLRTFKVETLYIRYGNTTHTDLYDKNGEKVLRVELTGSDMTVNRIEQILKRNKLRQL